MTEAADSMMSDADRKAAVLESLEQTEKGGVRNSIANCVTVLERDPLLAGAIAYNIMTERADIVKNLGWFKETPALTDTDTAYLQLYLETNYSLTSEKKIEKAIEIVADRNRYHPVRDYLNVLQWDGQERIRHGLHHFLGAEESDYTYEVMKLFMMGAIHRVFHPGCKFEVILCLVGGQGAGKSTFFRFLALKDEWFSDDLKKLEDENVYRKIQGNWIIEFSEMLATVNAKSIEEIKSFISRQSDIYKTPYAKHPKTRLRQCAFTGSSNSLDFLPLDRTGNRRFLPVMVYQEKADVHILENEKESRAYIEQMWAEAMVLYRQTGGKPKLKLTKEMEDYLKAYQQNFMPEDTKAGLILDYLDNYTGDKVCSLQLYKEALNHPFDDPSTWDIRQINAIMNSPAIEGWTAFSNPRRFEKYGRQKGWERQRTPDNEDKEIVDGFVEVTEQMELPF